MFVAVDGAYAGLVGVADRIKDTTVDYRYSPLILDESGVIPTGIWIAMDRESK